MVWADLMNIVSSKVLNICKINGALLYHKELLPKTLSIFEKKMVQTNPSLN